MAFGINTGGWRIMWIRPILAITKARLCSVLYFNPSVIILSNSKMNSYFGNRNKSKRLGALGTFDVSLSYNLFHAFFKFCFVYSISPDLVYKDWSLLSDHHGNDVIQWDMVIIICSFMLFIPLVIFMHLIALTVTKDIHKK